jgi:hypothetical protein
MKNVALLKQNIIMILHLHFDPHGYAFSSKTENKFLKKFKIFFIPIMRFVLRAHFS